MPAWRLDETDRQVTQYDVGASDGGETHFVGHVFLCDVDVPITVNSKSMSAPAVHMGPPLRRSSVKIDIIGTAELDVSHLSRGECRQIKTFIDSCLGERRAVKERQMKLPPEERKNLKSEYITHPAYEKPTRDCSFWRFNCAGFVLHAYLEANIELVNQENAPLVTVDFLKDAYPRERKRLDDLDFRKEMGIDIGDRWPVIMAGYVVNSLSRSAEEIRESPYTPRPGDEFFPAQPLEEETTFTS